MSRMNHAILIHLISFLLNIWFGYLRRDKKKLSFLWFLYIHLSIPFIIPLRIMWHINPWWIPSIILAAVCGQLVGARFLPRLLPAAK
jgi:hypothetical protein